MSELISPEIAEHAELNECYCGRTLNEGKALVCAGCGLVPEKCTCKELGAAHE